MLFDLECGNAMLFYGLTIYSLDHIVGEHAVDCVVHVLDASGGRGRTRDAMSATWYIIKERRCSKKNKRLNEALKGVNNRQAWIAGTSMSRTRNRQMEMRR